MDLKIASLVAASLASVGCAGYYEEGPAYGETPYEYARTTAAQPQQAGTVAAIANPAQQVQPEGQEVNIGAQNSDEYADTDPSALTDFKSTLDPYGTWADDSTYGTVWQPSPTVVGSDFAPYVSAGHWNYDNDYTWVSDYDWGWAPFHYGRWVFVAGRGWCWIPGRTYAGAWVSWRWGGPGYGYVGWGPLAPSWYWRGGYAYGLGVGINTPYAFCGTHDLFAPNVGGRIIAGPQVSTIANGTHVYNPNGRTPANPQVGGPLGGPGHMRPNGPVPTGELGLAPHMVPITPANAPGVVHAQQFAHASTATSLGGHAPLASAIPQPTRVPYPPQGTINPNRPVATAPQYNYGGQPRYAPPAYHPSYGPSYGPSYSGRPSYPTQAPYQSRGYSGGYPSGGGYGSYHSAPSYRVAPSAPSSSSYSHSYSHSSGGHSGGGHSGGGHR